MDGIEILYNQNNHSTIVVLEVIRRSENNEHFNLCSNPEREIRNLLEQNLKKDNTYNPKKTWIFRNRTDRVTLNYAYEEENRMPKEIHYHVYRGESENLDKILNFCEVNNISVQQGIENNLKQKYPHRHNRTIRKLLHNLTTQDDTLSA